MFGRLGGWEILIIVLLVVVLFGHNKIPGMMKNLADGINTFKRELTAKSKKGEKTPVNAGVAEKSEPTPKSIKKTAKKPAKAGASGRGAGGKKNVARAAKK